MSRTNAIVYLEDKYAKKNKFSVKDGEEFLTIAKDKETGMVLCYDPNRDKYELVALYEDQIKDIKSNQEEESEHFIVWGEKEAWDNTPSPVFNV